MNSEKLLLAALLGMGALVGAHGDEANPWAGLEDMLSGRFESNGAVQNDSLAEFAEHHGKTNEELASRLVEIVKSDFGKRQDGATPILAKSALWGLMEVGGEKERGVVREVMQTEEDYFRHVAMCVWIRMAPAEWEECIREIAADKRYTDLDRSIAYKEAYYIGRDGDERARQRVIEVLQEMRGADPCRSNRNRLGLWIAELDGNKWEEWLKEVLSSPERFVDADRYRAGELAFRAGKNGDDKTRRHVIDELTGMMERDTSEMNRRQYGRWLEELKTR